MTSRGSVDVAGCMRTAAPTVALPLPHSEPRRRPGAAGRSQPRLQPWQPQGGVSRRADCCQAGGAGQQILGVLTWQVRHRELVPETVGELILDATGYDLEFDVCPIPTPIPPCVQQIAFDQRLCGAVATAPTTLTLLRAMCYYCPAHTHIATPLNLVKTDIPPDPRHRKH